MKLSQIKTTLDSIKGCSFASLDATTEVKLTGGKKNPQQGRITKKTSNIRVILYATNEGYVNMVKRRLEKEGKDAESFTVSPLPWGERIAPNSPIIENKGKHFIQMIVQGAGESEYFIDNTPIAKSEIQGLPEKTPSAKQGLDNEVIVRTFGIDSIQEIRLMGQVIVA